MSKFPLILLFNKSVGMNVINNTTPTNQFLPIQAYYLVAQIVSSSLQIEAEKVSLQM